MGSSAVIARQPAAFPALGNASEGAGSGLQAAASPPEGQQSWTWQELVFLELDWECSSVLFPRARVSEVVKLKQRCAGSFSGRALGGRSLGGLVAKSIPGLEAVVRIPL